MHATKMSAREWSTFRLISRRIATAICWILVALCVNEVGGQLLDTEFQPTVTATCKAGYMTIRVNLNQSFVGAVHARDYRRPQCMVPGNGSNHATLGINLLATKEAPDYCGVLVNNNTEERSVPIAVRIHKTLELADDKFYVITCGKAGFKNAKNETSLVSLRLLDGSRRVQEAIYGHNYTLRAEISRPDGTYGIRVKSCFAFNKKNASVQLIDERGCPVKARVMTKFIYDRNTGTADATLFSMFRFSDSPQVHFQCDIAVCRGSCGTPICDDDKDEGIKGGTSSISGQNVVGEEGILLAGTSVYVLDPGEKPMVQASYEEGSIHPLWLLWLAVALGILFLIMLIINIFLCSAMTCSCSQTDIIEKEPSIEDYDPYRSWHGSQYGSRFDLIKFLMRLTLFRNNESINDVVEKHNWVGTNPFFFIRSERNVNILVNVSSDTYVQLSKLRSISLQIFLLGTYIYCVQMIDIDEKFCRKKSKRYYS